MRITIRNRTNKKISIRAKEDMRTFARVMVRHLGIEYWIKEIEITFVKDDGSYYPKDKPLFGFKKLFDGEVVKIDFSKTYGTSKDDRNGIIIHELTHVQQLIAGELKIADDCRTVYWKGKKTETWKKFRFAKYYKLKETNKHRAYIKKLLPWEAAVDLNFKKYSFLLDDDEG